MTHAEYLDALLALPAISNPLVSPDGAWVAWTWFRAGPAADVYAAPTTGTQAPVRLTDSRENTMLVSWTPDSRGVVVEEDQGGDERMQLFRVDVAQPLALTPLTPANPKYFLRGGELHPNCRWLIIGANVDTSTGAEIEPTWVYRRDITNGTMLALAKPRMAGFVVPTLNATGTHILYQRRDRHPQGQQIWLVDSDGQTDEEILNFGDDRKTYASWFPDGERVVVLAETPTHTQVGVWDRTTRQTRWLLDDPARNIEAAFVPHGSDQIVVQEVRAARLRCSLLHPITGAETPLPEIPGNLLPLAPVGAGAWVGLYYSAQQPTDLVRYPHTEPRPAHFVSIARVWERTHLRPADLTPAEDFHWQSVDGLAIQGWLYRAQGPARGTVVYVHGGPTSHSEDKINNQIQFFTHAGFHVLDPNYRGSTGFSASFREAIKANGWGSLEQEDIRTGIRALLAAGIATPGKVFITGTSYGGYSSWHAITHFTPDELSAAAPICGMTDLVVDYETTRPDLRPYSIEMMGGTPDEVPDRYFNGSAIHFVHNITGRLLIIQGDQDPNVSPENVRAVEAALQQADITYEKLTFPDEGHGISKPHNQKVLFERLLTFWGGG